MRLENYQGRKNPRVQFKKVEQPRKRVNWKTEAARQAYQVNNMDNAPTPKMEKNYKNTTRSSDIN
jgi:hypothetical protein